MATLLSHSPRRFLHLLKPKTILPRTLSPTMSLPSHPHFRAGSPPAGFGPSGRSSPLCTYSSDPRGSSGICGAGLAAVEGAASPDVNQVSADEGVGTTPNPAQKGDTETNLDRKTVKIMTYNVWSNTYVELWRRMRAIGDLIQHHAPDLICLQEVTLDAYFHLKNSDWWGDYFFDQDWWGDYVCEWPMTRVSCCMQMSKLPVDSFRSHSLKPRELWTADVSIGGVAMVLATTHLVSSCLATTHQQIKKRSDKRVAQAGKSLMILGGLPNVIFGGDMNWDEEIDGPFPLPEGWVDAWTELRPGEDGWTYDTKANPMLSANATLQKRVDRFVCRLEDFDLDSIEMIGKDALPGVSYVKKKIIDGKDLKLVLPVLPSDHFGLILTIARRQAGRSSSE